MVLLDKEALFQLYIELKEGEYKDRKIQYAILYFQKILMEKHKQITGIG